MRSATGTYHLDPTSAAFFGARNLRLIHRSALAIGKMGRSCSVRGNFDDHELRATWRRPDGAGWIKVKFDPSYTTFQGIYGVGDQSLPPIGTCSGRHAAVPQPDEPS